MSIRIAIDAMGGDYAPYEIVKGAVLAAKEYKVGIQLIGNEEEIKAELAKYDTNNLDIVITNATEIIEMGESPGKAIRTKKDSSIVKTVEAVAKGESQALVAAGSTGAAMAASLFGLGRLPGIDRPAIACLLPTLKRPVVLIDAGANSSCEPEMLYQFAIMGSIFAQQVLGYEEPRIGVLNIGGEAGKGNELAQNTYKLLSEKTDKINFAGNVEGRELFQGVCDVLVCDGFVGNVTLKVTEGVASMLFHLIKQKFKSSFLVRLAALIAAPVLMDLKKNTNYEEYGGALLLGVKGITVIAHGGSKAKAIKNAVRVAKESVEKDINGKISKMYELNNL